MSKYNKCLSVVMVFAIIFTFAVPSFASNTDFTLQNNCNFAMGNQAPGVADYVYYNNTIVSSLDSNNLLHISNSNSNYYTVPGSTDLCFLEIHIPVTVKKDDEYEFHIDISAITNGYSVFCSFSQNSEFADTFISSDTIEIDYKFYPTYSGNGYINVCVSVDKQFYGGNCFEYIIWNDYTLVNNDDNSGLIETIIQWLREIKEKIVNGFTDLGTTIGNFFSGLGDRIGDFFSGLGDRISDFFTALKNYLLYFQHPVTVNADGVPVNSNNEPVYTNPFSSAIENVKNQFNSWITSINNFISSVGSSAENVSSYLSTFKTIYERFGSAVPIFTAVISFSLAFIVIKKVVGR